MADDTDDARSAARVTRRGMLGGASLGVAAATAASAGNAAQASDADPHDDDPRRLTYRETDHIRAFYRRSRI